MTPEAKAATDEVIAKMMASRDTPGQAEYDNAIAALEQVCGLLCTAELEPASLRLMIEDGRMSIMEAQLMSEYLQSIEGFAQHRQLSLLQEAVAVVARKQQGGDV